MEYDREIKIIGQDREIPTDRETSPGGVYLSVRTAWRKILCTVIIALSVLRWTIKPKSIQITKFGCLREANGNRIRENASDFEKIQWAISELEKKVKVGSICDVRKPVNTGLQNRLVRLIGNKPIISCGLEGKKNDVLWIREAKLVCVAKGGYRIKLLRFKFSL